MNGAECTFCGDCTHDEWNCPKKKEEERKEIDRCVLYLIRRDYIVYKQIQQPPLTLPKKWWRFFTYKWWNDLFYF